MKGMDSEERQSRSGELKEAVEAAELVRQSATFPGLSGAPAPLTKVRPAVVVSRDHLNEQGRYIVLPISSRPAKGDEIPVPEHL